MGFPASPKIRPSIAMAVAGCCCCSDDKEAGSPANAVVGGAVKTDVMGVAKDDDDDDDCDVDDLISANGWVGNTDTVDVGSEEGSDSETAFVVEGSVEGLGAEEVAEGSGKELAMGGPFCGMITAVLANTGKTV